VPNTYRKVKTNVNPDKNTGNVVFSPISFYKYNKKADTFTLSNKAAKKIQV